jgi:osmotically-inducible protein OsmY
MLVRNVLLMLSVFLMLSGCVAAVSTGVMSLGIKAARDKTIGESLDDGAISLKIKKEFIAKGFKNLYTKINVEVFQGRVLYTGNVDKEEDIITAIDIAWNQKEVKEVINELSVSEDKRTVDVLQYSKDTWITTKVKSKIFSDRKIKFINYTVVTTNNVVYLFGLARSEEELQIVAEMTASVSGVEKVISHVKVKETQDVIHKNT